MVAAVALSTLTIKLLYLKGTSNSDGSLITVK